MNAMPARSTAQWKLVVVSVLVGLGLGVITVLGQKWLDGDWDRLANSGAVWLTVAFAVGSHMPSTRWAAAAGFATLIAAVIGYYAAVPLLVEGADASVRSVAIWLGPAIGGGPLFGAAGRWWRGVDATRSSLSTALMGGAFVAEGVYTLIRIAGPTGSQEAAGWTMLAIGLAVPVLLGHSMSERLRGSILLLPASLAGLAIFWILERVVSRV